MAMESHHGGSATAGEKKTRGNWRWIDNASKNYGLISGSSSSCSGGGRQWEPSSSSSSGTIGTIDPLLSNLISSRNGALKSLRSAGGERTTAYDPIFRVSQFEGRGHGKSSSLRAVRKGGRSSSSTRRRRVLASISLSQQGRNEKEEFVDDGIGRALNSISGSTVDVESVESAPNVDKGWFGEVVRARSVYKQISLLDRTKIGAIAGGLAGGFTYCVLHPIDTVRTKLQTRGASQLYTNGFEVVISVLKTRGITGFYSGISAVLVGSTFSSAVYFGCIELGRSALVKYTSCSAFLIPPLSGAFGNIVSSSILVPKEVIAQRMQAGAAGRSWDLALRTVQKEGIRGLYAGYAAALFRNLPSSVLSFTTFEYVKAAVLRGTGKKALEPWQSVLSGALAGAISGALTTPLDVVKTRLMTQAKKEVMGTVGGSTAAVEFSYKGVTSAFEKIWVEEGWKGFTKGMGPRLLHSAMFSALGYFAFETVRVELVKRHIAKAQQAEAQAEG